MPSIIKSLLKSLSENVKIDKMGGGGNGNSRSNSLNNNSLDKKRAEKRRRGRQCRIEELEGREMLSATPFGDGGNDCEEPDYGPFVEISGTSGGIGTQPAPGGSTIVVDGATYNQHEWNLVQSQGLQAFATWTEINGEQRLTRIEADSKNLTGEFDLSGCTELTFLDVRGNHQLTKLTVTNAPKLTTLYVSSMGGLTDLTITGTGLSDFSMPVSMNLVHLTISGNKSLTRLDLSMQNNIYNKVETLDLSNNNLSTITGLNLTNPAYLSKLTSLNLSGNPLTNFLGPNGELVIQNFENLTSLNVQGIEGLKLLTVVGNAGAPVPLTELNLTDSTNLIDVSLNHTTLTTLDVSNLTKLSNLDVRNNQLTEIIGINNEFTALWGLSVRNNNLPFSALPRPYGTPGSPLPAVTDGRYNYTNQGTYTLPETVATNRTVDLSKEFNVGTAITWHYANNSAVEPDRITNNGGIFQFHESLVGTSILAVMTNTAFPGLIIETSKIEIVSPPTLTGITVNNASPQVGNTITATLAPGDATATYQWYRGDTVIAGATNRTYTVTTNDIGYALRVSATGSGDYVGEVSRTTNEVPKIELTGVTVNNNSPVVGDTITATLTPSGATATYQWFRGDTVINGATANSYTVTADDIGFALKVVATGTGNSTGNVESGATSAVPEIVDLTGITVNNTSPQVGDTITATLDPSGATATYQWYRGNTVIDGATANTYTVTADDIGFALRVSATGIDNYTGIVESSATNAVRIELSDISLSNNSPAVGNTITATLDPTDATATYQWYRGNTAIAGATASSYTVAAADIGYALRVSATGTGDYTSTITSSATSAVPKIELTGITLNNNSPVVGNTIRATLNPSAGTATYQWYRDDTAIDGATNRTYTVTTDDIGYTLKVVATGTDNYAGIVESSATSAVHIALAGTITLNEISPVVGDTITATPDLNGTSTYQWFRGTTAIADAISGTYIVTTEDVGYALRVVATGTGDYGGTVASSTTSAVQIVLAGTVTLDEISPKVGDTITATPDLNGTSTYQWFRDDVAIEGATSSSYTVATADVGYALRVVATGTGNYTGIVESSATSVVPKVELIGITVSNNSPQVGNTITAALDPTGATATYQWYRGDTAIAGATNLAYIVTTNDIGYTLKISATGTDNYTGTVTSSATNIVTQQLTGITVSNTSPQVGDTITATLAPTAGTATYQWYRGETLIDGATSNSYTATIADVGFALKVVATGTGNYAGNIESNATNAVPQPTVALMDITINNTSPEVGDTISTTLEPADATAIYQWYRGENAITGAISSTYTVTTEDIGYALRVVATGTDNYTGEVSHTTNAVPNPVTELTGITVNNNSPQVGDTISATLEPADATVIYQWYRGDTAITAATSSTYIVTTNDIGYALRIVATGTDNYMGEVSHTTNAVPTPIVELTGITVNNTSPQVGDTISATITPSDATVIYQWYRGDTAIADATSSSYTATIADVGFVLKVVATGTGNYTGEVSHTLNHVEPIPVANPAAIPLHIRVAQTGIDAVTVSWNPVWNSSAGYQVWQHVSGEGEVAEWTLVATVTSTTATITSLTAGDYQFRVVAQGQPETRGLAEFSNSSASDTATITVTGTIDAGSVNSNFRFQARADNKATTTTASAITVNLNTNATRALEGVLYYELTYGIRGGEMRTIIIAGDAKNAVIAGLQANTTYRVEIQAYDKDGNAILKNSRGVDMPTVVNAKTLRGDQNLRAPNKITRAAGINSVTLNFSNAGNIPSNATHIMVEVWQGKNFVRTEFAELASIRANGNLYVVEDLSRNPNNHNRGLAHQFRIATITNIGEENQTISAFARISQATVNLNKDGRFPAVKNFRITYPASGQLQLMWNASPVSEVTHYEIGLRNGSSIMSFTIDQLNTIEALVADIDGAEMVNGIIRFDKSITSTGSLALGIGFKENLSIRAVVVNEDGNIVAQSANANRSVNVRQ